MEAKLPQNVDHGPSYLFTWSFEENFDYQASLNFFEDYWHVSYILGLFFYLPIIFIGQMIMKNREPFKLKVPLIFWNAGLALFSIIGFARVFPEMYYSLNKYGFQYTICNESFINVKPFRFWLYLFVLSKIPEFGDTFFLVLRKQRIIFLHVYHHVTVVIFCWFVYGYPQASNRWFCTMNYGVHAIMYTYYFLKAVPNFIKIPKWVSMLITSLQTIQMVMGLYAIIASYYAKLTGQECATTTPGSALGFVIYGSYLFLFSKFFYNAYCSPPPAKERIQPAIDKKHV